MLNKNECAVIFDMDGVLIDSEPVYMSIERRLFAEAGAPISEEEHQRFVGAPVAGLWRMVVERATRPCRVEEIHEESRRRIRAWLESPEPLHPMPGVERLLTGLQSAGYPLAVASSSSRHNIETILRRLGIIDRFAVIVSGHEVVNGKPAPDIFLEAARQLGIAPEACVVIEDSRNGVTGAKAAGMRCIGVQNPGSGNQDLAAADFIVDSLQQINPEDPCACNLVTA